MVAPVRFPSGISTFPTRHPLSTFPTVPNMQQMARVQEFFPFRGTSEWTSTLITGTIAPIPWPTGLLQFNNTAAGTSKSALALNGNLATNLGMQLIPGYSTWFSAQIAPGPTNTDTNIYAGLFNNADPTAATSGIYFIKPSGGTAVNLVMKRLFGGVTTTTTIQNVADLARPSGIFGDTSSTVGTLGATQSGGYYNSISVTAPGAGYASAPVVIATGATGANATAFVGIGSGSLYAPYIANSGNAAYTTATLEVDHLIDLELVVDSKGTVVVGVNGKQVCAIGYLGGTVLAAGGTVSAVTSNNYQMGTNLPVGISPIQPLLGSAYITLPSDALVPAVALANTTANIRNLYVETINAGQEFF